MATVPGTKGYSEQAEQLVSRYESIPFAVKHRAVLHLIPRAPCEVLDIGAGTGADAAWFADAGHRVVAVEPTAELRNAGMALHSKSPVEWLDDSLPDLSRLPQGGKFDVVMITAVWMHLDEKERATAMPRVASLLRPQGVLIMSLRHGPHARGRRTFDVSAEETVRLASGLGLRCTLNVRTESAGELNRQAGITWSRLAFAF